MTADAGETSEKLRHAPPTRLVLVRHAVTVETGDVLTGRSAGVHLSARGRDQAEATAQRLASADVAAVYASPMERTMETAEILARAHTLPVVRSDDVVEADFGNWTGEKLTDLAHRDEWRVVQNAPSRFRFPGGESFLEMQTRTVQGLERIAEQHNGALVVVVSHADPIRAALAHYAGTSLDLFQRFIVGTASVSVIAIGPSGTHVVRINDTGDLSELAPASEAGGENRRSPEHDERNTKGQP